MAATLEAVTKDHSGTGQSRRMHIGHRLVALRTEAGLTQPELSALTRQTEARLTGDPAAPGVGIFTISRAERNRRHPRPQTARLLAETLTRCLGRKITPAYLASTDDPSVTLYSYLEQERARRKVSSFDFYFKLLRMPHDALRGLRDHGTIPPSGALSRIVQEIPEAQHIILDLLASTRHTE